MNIRLMTIEDYSRVYALWLSAPNMGLNNLDDSKEGIAKYLARNPSTCFVAENESCIVGTILSGHDGRRGSIYHAVVVQSEQCRGIGAALVNAAMGALKEAGIHKVSLVAFRENKEGNAFWEKQGFTVREDLVYRNKLLSELTRMDT